MTSVVYKHETILEIIKKFPERKFVLVGDSGEKDIEIYEKVRAFSRHGLNGIQ
jgi:phosphatidate phosphatase APP1